MVAHYKVESRHHPQPLGKPRTRVTYPLRDQHSPGSMQSRNQPGIKNRIEHFYLLAGMLPQLNQILAWYFIPCFPFLDRCEPWSFILTATGKELDSLPRVMQILASDERDQGAINQYVKHWQVYVTHTIWASCNTYICGIFHETFVKVMPRASG